MQEIRLKWPYPCFGFMDFIRGVMSASQLFLDTDIKITPTMHPAHGLAKVFDWSNTHLYDEHTDLWYDIPSSVEKEITYVVYGGMPDLKAVSSFRWLLTPKRDYITQILPKLSSIVQEDYDVVHVRTEKFTGDNFPETNLIKHVNMVRAVSEKNTRPTVLVSDNTDIKAACSHLLQSEIVPKHSGFEQFNDNAILGWLVDLMLICQAKEVTSICDFAHGSTGFAMIPCAVFGIPWRNINTDKQTTQSLFA